MHHPPPADKRGWGIYRTPTDASHVWHAEKDCEDLFKAMKGLGTDEAELIRIICDRSREHLLEVQKVFKAKYSKELIAEIHSETSGRFRRLLKSLLMPRADWMATLVDEAFKGAGAKGQELVLILCPRTGFEIKEINEAYHRLFGRSIKERLEKEVAAPRLKKFLIRIVAGGRDDNEFEVDVEKAKVDAKKLYDGGEGKLGTDDNLFFDILATRSHAQLAAMSRAYADLTGKSFDQALKKEFKGPVRKALVAASTNIGEFYAERLFEAMKGAGTDDTDCLIILTSLNFAELKMVNQWYLVKYKKTLHAAITGDFSGDLKKSYLFLVPSTL